MVSVCATVDARVAVNTPEELVVPVMGAKVLLPPLADSVTVSHHIAAGVLHRHCKGGGRRAIRRHQPGDATMVDLLADGAPATTAPKYFLARCPQSP